MTADPFLSLRLTVGFTGTREGMTAAQRTTLSLLLALIRPARFVHGDAIGADGQADAAARLLGIERMAMPCTLSRQRAYCATELLWPEILPPLARNRRLAGEVHLLLAAPREAREERRSGTWATVRYAEALHKPVLVLEPDGRIQPRGPGLTWVAALDASTRRAVSSGATPAPPEPAPHAPGGGAMNEKVDEILGTIRGTIEPLSAADALDVMSEVAAQVDDLISGLEEDVADAEADPEAEEDEWPEDDEAEEDADRS